MGWVGGLVMGKMSLRTKAERTAWLVLLSASNIHAGVSRRLLGPPTDRTHRLRGELGGL